MAQYKKAEPSFRSRQTARIPFITSEHINAFSGTTIQDLGYTLYNCIVDSYNGEPSRSYITQRPAVTLQIDASEEVTDDAGRGIHWWSANSNRYFMNNDTIYKGDYTTPCTMYGSNTAINPGTEKVYFVEYSNAYDDYLFIIDPEDNNAYVINGDASTVVVNLKDYGGIGSDSTGAPFHASQVWNFDDIPFNMGSTDEFSLCHGAVVLDQYLFLGTKSGSIYSCEEGDFFIWNSEDVTEAERENDQLLCIAKSRDHLVALGTRTIEFFYDNANPPPGSPLERRADIMHNVGVVNGMDVWNDGDDVYFLGVKPTGDFNLYLIADLNLTSISTSTLNSYFKQSRVQRPLNTMVSGASTGGHTYIMVTVMDENLIPKVTLVYDAYAQAWYEWNITLLDLDMFPVIGTTYRTPELPVTFEGIMLNGDVFFLGDDFTPVDRTATAEDAYFSAGYNVDGDAGTTDDYSLSTFNAGSEVEETANIIMKAALSNLELDSTDTKFMHSAEYVGNSTHSPQTLSVSWSDDAHQNWTSSSIDVQKRHQINRMGSFISRSFKIQYSGDEQIRMEGLDVNYTMGIS